MTVTVEPEGPRLDAAYDLENAIHRRNNPRAFGRLPHPLDDLEPRFAEFVYRPADRPFVPWSDFRVDVSNDRDKTLYDNRYVKTLYSSWQVLQAAEMAEMGIHILVNLADEGKLEAAFLAGRDGHEMPTGPTRVSFTPVHLLQDFATHTAALDAVVWFVEESNLALVELGPKRSGRYILTADETKTYREEQQAAAQNACNRFGVNGQQLIELARFLFDRWREWDGDGRPLIADEYKRYLGKAVLLAQLGTGINFETARAGIGFYRSDKFLLDTAFPDWAENEKNRARMTLIGMIRKPDANVPGISEEEIKAFVEFIDKKGHHAFFWRLRSIEEHTFRGNEFALSGMRSDIQGMAVIIEHVVRDLGGERVKDKWQLYKMFEVIWKGSNVARVMSEAARLTKPGKGRPPTDWSTLKTALDDIAQKGKAEKIASDLIMAHRIRGAVHYTLDEENQFELERLFVLLMRAALLTFAHVRHAPEMTAPLAVAAAKSKTRRQKKPEPSTLGILREDRARDG